ncbi:hypothetical protein [Polyangium jinanense]|uniref:Lipoprotein n=1 Tax=Polyangium jinanense TaxID=2829994 RepID=A0A9X3XA07_9BACT|nr:hypothetical protein [Polyangium jinanense]MDC3961381.1 hypothetical protein [Polyangium jinanense]MDC3986982.1 hypothetical protein [Polyangium jinanense]
MTVRPTPLSCFVLLVLSLAGCADEESSTEVVVGLTTNMAVGFDFYELDRTLKVDGVALQSEHLSYGAGSLLLPAELRVPTAEDGATIELSLTAKRIGEDTPVVTREARTRVLGGQSLLLPVSLDEACALVSCAANSTCVRGACVDPFLDPSSLAAYDPAWIHSADDACKTASSGDPAIVVGQGQMAFATLTESEVVPIEQGPQGGHHVWLALRVTGLRQMGSKLKVSGFYPDLEYKLPPFSSQVTLRKAGDHCEMYGIRFQVDRGIAVETVRGLPLDIDLVLTDPTGDTATARTQVVIAPS